ncbi:MAG: hypothetical protein WCX81_04565, partial [Monoglobales bacterium]
MKKITSLAVLVVLVLSLSTSVFAQTPLPVDKETTLAPEKPSPSMSMEQALISVKSKIEVPSSLDIFESSMYTNNNKLTYNFYWRDKDYKSSLQIMSDSKGRITDYNYYSDSMSRPSQDKKLPAVSKA